MITTQGEIPGMGKGFWRWWVWGGEAGEDTQAVSLQWLHSGQQCCTNIVAVEASWGPGLEGDLAGHLGRLGRDARRLHGTRLV